MADRKPSTVAAYLKKAKRPGGVALSGGRGRRGPLGGWLLREKNAIADGRKAVPALTWREVSALAAADGIVRKDGTPYPEREVRKAWSNLADARLVPRGSDGVPARAQQVPTGTVPPSRGQGGTEGAGGVQPPAPMPPTTATSPAPVDRTGEAAPKKPAPSMRDMPVRRRFGEG